MQAKLSAHRLRGQALTETLLILPVFLITLFGILWVTPMGIVNERLQFAVRYSGLVSNVISPYSEWSLYSLYADSIAPNTTPFQCSPPPLAAMVNASPFPGPVTAPYWQPPANTFIPNCSNGISAMTGGPQPAMMLYSNSSASTQAIVTTTGGAFNAANSSSAPQFTAVQKFFAPADLNTILQCYSDVGIDVANSLLRRGGSTTNVPPALIAPAGGPLTMVC